MLKKSSRRIEDIDLAMILILAAAIIFEIIYHLWTR
jgi:hypothetical protein